MASNIGVRGGEDRNGEYFQRMVAKAGKKRALVVEPEKPVVEEVVPLTR